MSTEWIQPGAPIAVYIKDWQGARQLFYTTVARVAKRSFRVDQLDERFSLDTLQTPSTGASFLRARYVATHPDSEQANLIREHDRRERAKTKVRRYLHNDADSLEQVDQAIQALTEWRTLLTPEVPQ